MNETELTDDWDERKSAASSRPLVLDPRLKSYMGMSLIKLSQAVEQALAGDNLQIIQLDGIGKEYVCHCYKNLLGSDQRVCFDFPADSNQMTPELRLVFTETRRVHFSYGQDFRVSIANVERDDVIDAMLRLSPSRCKSVLDRLDRNHYTWLSNDIEIWNELLHHLAVSDDSVEESLWKLLLRESTSLWAIQSSDRPRIDELRLCEYCLKSLDQSSQVAFSLLRRLARIPCNGIRIESTWLHSLIVHQKTQELIRTFKSETLEYIANRFRNNRTAKHFLTRACQGLSASTAASILFRMDEDWKPRLGRRITLDRCWFGSARWARIKLREIQWNDCHLYNSNLSRSKQTNVHWNRCILAGANFDHSVGYRNEIRHCDASLTSFVGMDLRESQVVKSRFLCNDWSMSQLKDCALSGCDFHNATFQKAVWQHCRFRNCRFVRCDFTDFDTHSSTFSSCVFEDCKWSHGFLRACQLDQLKLEDTSLDGLDLQDCSLVDAELTGTHGNGLNLIRANLQRIKLADIVWQSCNLQNCDLRGAVFRFGSTRCGMVGSPYPSHGTRTGFYDDTQEELYFKEPELVRRAALLNCDLRGANIDGVDFYLVDLRGTKLEPKQQKQAIATGAIL